MRIIINISKGNFYIDISELVWKVAEERTGVYSVRGET